MFSSYPEIMSVKDLQSALNIGRNEAYKLISDGKIPHMRIGKNIKIPRCLVVEFVFNNLYNSDASRWDTDKEVS